MTEEDTKTESSNEEKTRKRKRCYLKKILMQEWTRQAEDILVEWLNKNCSKYMLVHIERHTKIYGLAILKGDREVEDGEIHLKYGHVVYIYNTNISMDAVRPLAQLDGEYIEYSVPVRKRKDKINDMLQKTGR